MAEKHAKEVSGYREIERRERIKRLAELMSGSISKEKQAKKANPIYEEELEKGVDEIIEQEAIELYKKLTGKNKVPEEIPQEYKDRALMEVLKRWQQTLKEIKTTVLQTAISPEIRMRFKELPPKPPLCPKCSIPMKNIMGGLWQCPKCYKIIRLPT